MLVAYLTHSMTSTLVSNSVHATSQNLIKSDSNHSVWGALGVPDSSDLNFQNFFVRFGLTDSSISVIPRSRSRSRFSISVQPIWTFRSHRVSVTSCSYESRCHRVVPLGHTDRVGLHISTGNFFGNFSELFRPRLARSASRVSGSSSLSPAASYRWSPPPSMEFVPAVATVASSSPN